MWKRAAVWAARGGYLALLGGLLVLSSYAAFSLFVRRGVTPVPPVLGLSLEEAERLLTDHGLEARHREPEDRFDDDVPPERILEQRPAPGSLAKRGGFVDLVMSKGRRVVTVPDLRGKALPAAQVTLAGAGLELRRAAYVFAADVLAGTVADQHPPVGAEIGRGEGVELFLAAEGSAETYVMPDLVDRDYRRVRLMLEARGFRVGSVKYEPYEGITEPVILRQFPLPGHPLRRGDVISLVAAAVADPELGP